MLQNKKKTPPPPFFPPEKEEKRLMHNIKDMLNIPGYNAPKAKQLTLEGKLKLPPLGLTGSVDQ